MPRKMAEKAKDISSGRFRWNGMRIGARNFMRLGRMTDPKHRNNDRADCDGQALAGSGALVFEGEVLELPRRH